MLFGNEVCQDQENENIDTSIPGKGLHRNHWETTETTEVASMQG